MTTYLPPIILASDLRPATKERLIEIYKSEVYKDIDLYTHKHVDGSQSLQDLRARNAISSDVTEDVDAAVITRYVEFWNSYLRDHIQFALKKRTDDYADDMIHTNRAVFRYELTVPDEFEDIALRPLAEFIHRFLVFGALFDWYNQFGMERQAASYKSRLDSLADTITSTLRGSSIQKRPMQPFGPAQPF